MITFQKEGRVDKEIAPSIIEQLMLLTERGNRAAVAEACGVNSGVITLVMQGKTYLRKDHLKAFARHHSMLLDELLEKISADKKEGPKSHTLFIPEDKRASFMIGLQSDSGLNSGAVFKQKIEQGAPPGKPKEATFMATGHVPPEWLDLIDTEKRASFVARMTFPNQEKPTPPQPQKKKRKKRGRRGSTAKKNDCKVPTEEIPSEFFKIFLIASYAAGKAAHLNLALEAFLGALNVRLPKGYSVESSIQNSIITVTVENGKTVFSYELNTEEVLN